MPLFSLYLNNAGSKQVLGKVLDFLSVKWGTLYIVVPKVLAQTRSSLANITIAIPLRFDYDSTTTIAIIITIRLRFDSSKWTSWQYVNECV